MRSIRESGGPRARVIEASVGGLEGLWACGARVRRRRVGLVWAEAVLRVVGGLIVLVAAGLMGDWLWEWPRWVRAGAWVLDGTACLGGLWWYGFRRWRQVPSGDQLALSMERRDPELRSRLISAVQLGRDEAWRAGAGEVGPAYVARLIREAERRVSAVSPATWAPGDELKRVAKAVGGIGVGAALAWVGGGATSGILLRRALGADEALPRATRILEISGDRVVGRGDDLAISAVVGGVIPKEGQLILRHGTGRVQKLALDPDGERPGRFERVLVNLTADFRYRVRLHDAESLEYQVTVLPRPVVTELRLTVEYPAYTGLVPRGVVPGELTLLRGSRLRVEGLVSQGVERVGVRLEGLEREVAARVEESSPQAFRVVLPADELGWTGFSVELRDKHGIESRDPAVYAVSVVEDQPPTVRVVVPTRREELVTPRGTVMVAFEARDDFGLAALRLVHQPAGSPDAQRAAIQLAWEGEVTNVVRRRFEWKLAELRPPVQEGMFLEFWVEAEDRRDVGGAGVGRSERYLARVVSEAEKRLDLLTRAGDAIGRLGDVATGQERLNESLGRIILEKPAPR